MPDPWQQPDPLLGRDATVSLAFANMVALLLLPVTYIIILLPYQWKWAASPLADTSSSIGSASVIILALIVGVTAHELLHAAGFILLGKVPVSAIHFGFSWRGMAPYAQCGTPVKANVYRVSVLLPGIILGLLPAIAGVALRIGWLTLWGVLMIIAAGGDLAVLWAMRTVDGAACVLDHPKRPGCRVLSDESRPY